MFSSEPLFGRNTTNKRCNFQRKRANGVISSRGSPLCSAGSGWSSPSIPRRLRASGRAGLRGELNDARVLTVSSRVFKTSRGLLVPPRPAQPSRAETLLAPTPRMSHPSPLAAERAPVPRAPPARVSVKKKVVIFASRKKKKKRNKRRRDPREGSPRNPVNSTGRLRVSLWLVPALLSYAFPAERQTFPLTSLS